MATWTTLTETNVLDVLNNAELTAAKTIALAPSQGSGVNIITNILGWVMDFVRGVAKTQVTPPATGVPPILVLATLDIAVFRLLNRVSAELAEKRKAAHDDALAMLKDVVEGKLQIDVGDASISGIPTINDVAHYTTLQINDRTITRVKAEGM